MAVCGYREVPRDAELHDCGNNALLPGLVDTHVHINEPGRTEWEGFSRNTRRGGGRLHNTSGHAAELPARNHYGCRARGKTRGCAGSGASSTGSAWGAQSPTTRSTFCRWLRGSPGFKCFLIYPGCDGFTMVDQRATGVGIPRNRASPACHCWCMQSWPDRSTKRRCDLRNADWRSYATYLASRPDEAELQAIRLMIRLCREYRFRLHIVHLSTALALSELRAARAEGLPITVETCPHYLHFSAERDSRRRDTVEVRSTYPRPRKPRGAVAGLGEGNIDMIVTDHSPCPPEMKRRDEGRFDRAWGGIASLSVALPVIYTECISRGFDCSRDRCVG